MRPNDLAGGFHSPAGGRALRSRQSLPASPSWQMVRPDKKQIDKKQIKKSSSAVLT
jgi:hypothetical protein